MLYKRVSLVSDGQTLASCNNLAGLFSELKRNYASLMDSIQLDMWDKFKDGADVNPKSVSWLIALPLLTNESFLQVSVSVCSSSSFSVPTPHAHWLTLCSFGTRPPMTAAHKSGGKSCRGLVAPPSKTSASYWAHQCKDSVFGLHEVYIEKSKYNFHIQI